MDNQRIIFFIRQFRFLVVLTWIACIVGLGYGLFGDALQGFGQGPEIIPIEKQGRGSQGERNEERIENGIHLATGLRVGKGFDIVRQTCTGCHSAKLITQNRATRQGWKEMIVWMQETQGLWQLGRIEDDVLDYLSTYYAPKEKGRRAPLALDEIEWYMLEEN